MVALPSVAERRAQIDARHPVWQRQTLDSAFLKAAGEFANRPFVITDEVSWTYADVAARSEAIAKGLRASGIRPGDRVALLMANYPEFLPAAYAVWRLGATLIPVNFAFRAQELAYVLEQSQCRALITMSEFRGLDYLAMLDELSPGWEQAPGLRFNNLAAVVLFGATRPGVPALADVARRGAADSMPLAANTVSPDEPAVIMYTSGTTGQPKGVLQSHDNLLRNSFATARHRAYEDGRRILFALPLYHAFALVVGVLTVPWAGGAVVPQLVFDPLQTIQAIERHKVSDALFVPTMAIAVVEHPAVSAHDLSSLFACLSAAAATPLWVWRRMVDGLQLTELVTGYGMTETSAGLAFTEPGGPLELLETTVGQIIDGGAAGMPELGGRVAVYKTCDPFTGAILPDGAEGELICRSPMATRGYFALPQRTAELFLEGGWLRSGDLGRVLPDGTLVLTGRSKELYKSGGELVAPKEVEDVLCAHEGVEQAFVIGLPDERWGEIGAAWIVRSGAAQVSEAELITWSQARLAKFKWPRHILFASADELPKTPTGKVQKFELIRIARARLGRT